MNRWQRLLVLWLLCVTMPLQAMAALRTHCAPGSAVPTVAQLAVPMVAMMSGMSHGDATMQHAMHGGQHDAMAAGEGVHDMTLHASNHASDHNAAPDTSGASTSHSHHASCSACAACVVCTALPQSLAIRTPDAQPSAAIPFLRTSAASAFVATLERPPRAFLV